VYLNDRKKTINRLFFSLAVSISIWVLSVLVEVKSIDETVSLLSSRIALGAAVLVAFFMYRFTYHFPKKFTEWDEYIKQVSIASAIVFALSVATPFVLTEVWELEGGLQQNVYGPGSFLFGGYLIALISASVYMLLSKYKTSRKKADRKQVALILIGFSISIVITFTTNLLLPLLGFVGTLQFGPPSIIFFIGFASYAILRHHLFNVQVVATAFLSFLFILFSIIHIPFMGPGIGIYMSVFMFVIAALAVAFAIRSALDEVHRRKELEEVAHRLEKTNAELQRLDKLRKDFFSFASHQLRQPLVVMKGYASLIENGEYGETPPKMKQAAKKIVTATDQLNLVVNNFLDLRAIEEGKMQYAFKIVDVADLVRSVVEEYKSVIEVKGLTITVKTTPEVIEGEVDVLKFRQVIQNLIDNAMKYTQAGSITVTVREEGGMVEIVVRDTGMGMEKQLLKALFSEFVRDRSAVKKEIRGTGLGLYLIKKIIDAHKGKVWATSDGINKGSEFHILLPALSGFVEK
jgi:signal transduction histidine kinase